MASMYETLNTYTPYKLTDPMGAGAWTPGLDTGKFLDPGSTAAATAADVAAGGATGPWGTDANLAGGVKGIDIGGGSKGWGGGSSGGSGIGWNLGTLDVALGGLKTIAGVWQAWEQNKIAKQQLAMQRNLANANLGNQTLAYNAAYRDRIENRMQSGGWTAKQGADYLKQYSLPTRTV